jgi:hypothetical protein
VLQASEHQPLPDWTDLDNTTSPSMSSPRLRADAVGPRKSPSGEESPGRELIATAALLVSNRSGSDLLQRGIRDSTRKTAPYVMAQPACVPSPAIERRCGRAPTQLHVVRGDCQQVSAQPRRSACCEVLIHALSNGIAAAVDVPARDGQEWLDSSGAGSTFSPSKRSL